MIKVKLYLYDSNESSNEYRGEDLSSYVLVGSQNTENLTEELDVSNITLEGINKKESFAPETKFIIDIAQDTIEGKEEILYTYHRIVEEDVVEQPILSDSNYYKHTISFIEPSAIAQKRIVDNIAITYKLKDVNLETRTSFDESKIAQTRCQNSPNNNPTRGFANYVDTTFWSSTRNNSFGKYFIWKKPDESSNITLRYRKSGQYISSSRYYTNISDIDDNGQDDPRKFVSFEVPVPHIMWGVEDTQAYNTDNPRRPPILQSPAYEDIGIASFTVSIIEKDLFGEITAKYTQDFLSSNNLSETVNTTFPYLRIPDIVNSYRSSYNKQKFEHEYLIEKIDVESGSEMTAGGGFVFSSKTLFYFSKFTDSSSASAVNYKNQNVYTNPIEIKENHFYSIEIKVKNLAEGSIPVLFNSTIQNGAITYANTPLPYAGEDYVSFSYTKTKHGYSPYTQNTSEFLLSGNSYISSEFTFFGVDGISAVIASGNPYNALNVVKKAIINSDVFLQNNDLSSVDINDELSPYPFYVSTKDEVGENILSADDLVSIQVNETFYRQKNLFEILLDVGKYAHAIPQIRFGKNNKLAISFYKLGTTNKKEQTNTPISIMNYRKIDEYISACSSYVDNLVQLGGYVTEKVAPKSTSENFVVLNDTAKIIVSKPILEIIKVEAYPTKNISLPHNHNITFGDSRDITEYIYENAIYNILSVRYDQVPNKGIALYYDLGDKEIKGGDYQLPQKVTNAYTDFAFKKILFSAYFGYDTNYPTSTDSDGDWVDIKVNDFIFIVTYRTKDSARLEHTRPDIRHYLLTTDQEKVPYHKQFNNQQDILVDSVAFGANMFGKLIRTGNNNYKVHEWVEDLGSIKHKGELYLINSEWYYVGKVTNIFFPDHIESIVEYSKDYNQLSSIIGIPSEPRFYEISERSSIDREVAINDYLLVTTDENNINTLESMINNITHTKDLIFANGGTFLRWAESHFKGDPNISLIDQATFGMFDFEKSILSPISAYSCGTTLTYEWDMEDNFSAGDNVSEEVQPDGDVVDNSYRTLSAVQYCDKYGKSTLFDFTLYEELSLTGNEIRNLPNSPFVGDSDRFKSAAIDADNENGENWLCNVNNGAITYIKPAINTTYSVGKVDGHWNVVGVNLFIDDIWGDDNFPEEPGDWSTYLHNKFVAAEGRNEREGDKIVISVYSSDYTILEVVWLFKWENVEWVWNEWLFENPNNRQLNVDTLYFKWNDETQLYEEDYASSENKIVTNRRLGKSIVLLKDSRETLHFNYNLMLITDSDTFVVSPFFFAEKTGISDNGKVETPGIEIAVLSEEVNKMSNGYVSMNNLIDKNTNPIVTVTDGKFVVDMSWINNLSAEKKETIKSIVILQKDQQTENVKQFILAKNIPAPPISSVENWYFGAPNKEAIWSSENGNRQ